MLKTFTTALTVFTPSLIAGCLRPPGAPRTDKRLTSRS